MAQPSARFRSRYRAPADRPKDRKERYANPDRALMFPNVLMRCGLRPMTRVSLVCAADRPDAGGTADRRLRAVARLPAIRRGESATQAARRVTGNGRNAYQAWFQIMNPSSRFVPKSQYNRIRARLAGLRHQAGHARHGLRTHFTSPPPKSPRQPEPDASEAPDGSGVPEARARRRTALATIGVVDGAADGAQPAAIRRSSKTRRCRSHDAVACALRWLCRGSGGGSSTTISLAGRRHPSSCGTLPIDSSMSSNGHWFGTTPGSVP